MEEIKLFSSSFACERFSLETFRCEERPLSNLFIMEARECKKVHFDLKEGKQIATRPMNLCYAPVSQSQRGYERSGLSVDWAKWRKSISVSRFPFPFFFVICYQFAEYKKSESLLSHLAGIADKSSERSTIGFFGKHFFRAQ